MLTELHIENVAVISKLTVTFENGFSVLTGETGAGKSIIIDAINMVLGERTSKELIRTGENNAYVSALFRDVDETVVAKLNELGFDSNTRSLMISRELSLDGKSVARIDGRPVTASLLKEIGKLLVNIHGQNDTQFLMLPEKHFEFVDTFGKCERELDEYREIYREISSVREEIKNLSLDKAEKERKTDLLSYQINEIEAASLKIGEEALLIEKKNVIRSGAKLLEALNGAFGYIEGSDNDGALTGISQAIKLMSQYCDLSQKISKMSEALEDAKETISDVRNEMADYIGSIDCDKNELAEIEDRLDLIYRLKQKYGADEERILEFCSDCKKELERITFSSEKIEQLSKEYDILLLKLKEKADILSEKRRKACVKLEEEVVKELSFLNMSNVKFSVVTEPCKFNINGGEKLEFYISANKGETPKPLAKVASGGELSRIMLAIKSIFADVDKVKTLIFDEIDTGVSGSAADKIGVKIHELSKKVQVICITHLPQIASKADIHYLIYKDSDADKTYTHLSKLTIDERAKEVARLMSGSDITESALTAAKEMLINEMER